MVFQSKVSKNGTRCPASCPPTLIPGKTLSTGMIKFSQSFAGSRSGYDSRPGQADCQHRPAGSGLRANGAVPAVPSRPQPRDVIEPGRQPGTPGIARDLGMRIFTCPKLSPKDLLHSKV